MYFYTGVNPCKIKNIFWIASQARNDGEQVSSLRGTKQSRRNML